MAVIFKEKPGILICLSCPQAINLSAFGERVFWISYYQSFTSYGTSWIPAVSHIISLCIWFLGFPLSLNPSHMLVRGLGLGGRGQEAQSCPLSEGSSDMWEHVTSRTCSLSSCRAFCPPGCKRHLLLIFLRYSSIHHVKKKLHIFSAKTAPRLSTSWMLFTKALWYSCQGKKRGGIPYFCFSLTLYGQGLFQYTEKIWSSDSHGKDTIARRGNTGSKYSNTHIAKRLWFLS